jgi:hypothetical protein
MFHFNFKLDDGVNAVSSTEKQHKFYTLNAISERPFKAIWKGLPWDESMRDIKLEIHSLRNMIPIEVIRM